MSSWQGSLVARLQQVLEGGGRDVAGLVAEYVGQGSHLRLLRVSCLAKQSVRCGSYARGLLAVDGYGEILNHATGASVQLPGTEPGRRLGIGALASSGDDVIVLADDGIVQRYSSLGGELVATWTLPRACSREKILVDSAGSVYVASAERRGPVVRYSRLGQVEQNFSLPVGDTEDRVRGVGDFAIDCISREVFAVWIESPPRDGAGPTVHCFAASGQETGHLSLPASLAGGSCPAIARDPQADVLYVGTGPLQPGATANVFVVNRRGDVLRTLVLTDSSYVFDLTYCISDACLYVDTRGSCHPWRYSLLEYILA